MNNERNEKIMVVKRAARRFIKKPGIRIIFSETSLMPPYASVLAAVATGVMNALEAAIVMVSSMIIGDRQICSAIAPANGANISIRAVLLKSSEAKIIAATRKNNRR